MLFVSAYANQSGCYLKFYIVKENYEQGISPELEFFMKQSKISSVRELLSIGNEELLKMDGFGWRLMKEVLSLRLVH